MNQAVLHPLAQVTIAEDEKMGLTFFQVPWDRIHNMGGIALVLSNGSLDREHRKEQVNLLPFQLLSGVNLMTAVMRGIKISLYFLAVPPKWHRNTEAMRTKCPHR